MCVEEFVTTSVSAKRAAIGLCSDLCPHILFTLLGIYSVSSGFRVWARIPAECDCLVHQWASCRFFLSLIRTRVRW